MPFVRVRDNFVFHVLVVGVCAYGRALIFTGLLSGVSQCSLNGVSVRGILFWFTAGRAYVARGYCWGDGMGGVVVSCVRVGDNLLLLCVHWW